MRIDLLEDAHSATPPPPALSSTTLHHNRRIKRMPGRGVYSDDRGIVSNLVPATRSRVANSPSKDNLHPPWTPKTPMKDNGSSHPTLRASVAPPIPRESSTRSKLGARTVQSPTTRGHRASGTRAAKSDLHTTSLRAALSSTYSSRTHTPEYTTYCRQCTPSPVPSCRSSTSYSSFRSLSPLLFRSASTRAVSPLESQAPRSISRSSSYSRRASYSSLPGLDSSQDTSETSPPTSLSSRNSPLGAEAGAGIVVSSDEDVDRLFRFTFKPADYEGKDCGILLDVEDRNQPTYTCGSADGPTKDAHTSNAEPTDEAPPKTARPRATLLSVAPIEDDLVDLLEPAQPVTSSKATATASLLDKIRSISKQREKAASEQRTTSEPLLVDLSDETPGMGRVPISQSLRTLQYGLGPNKHHSFGMSVPGPSRQSDGRRPESSRQPRLPRQQRPARDRPQAKTNGQPVDPDTDLGSVIPRTQGRTSLGQARPNARPRDRAQPVSSRASSPDRLNSVIAERYKTLSPYRQLLSRKYPQRTIPPTLLDLEQKDSLQWSLMKAWKGTEPKAQQKEFITQLLELLSDTVNERLSTPGASLEKGKRRFEVDVFGSVSWGGATGASGDLDLIVLDHQMPFGYHPSKWRIPPGVYTTNSSKGPRTPLEDLPAIYRMRAVERELARIGMRETMPIISATTPIVKFKEPSGRMECDINVNDLGGWYNSSLILHYCLISPHVLRPMIYALKLWAKGFDLNDPSGARGAATLSSYCLTLMAIAYLQHRGVLPNLQASVKAEVPSDNTREEVDTVWVGWGKDQGIKAHIGFDRSPPPGWKPATTLTAADAVRGFFSYFNRYKKDNKTSKDGKAKGEDKTQSTDRLDYDTNIVSILQGGIAKRLRPPGGSNREEAQLRSQMIKDGQSEAVVKEFFKKRREEQDEKDTWIGKGDKDMQPRAWEEKTLVVQDPFLWQKNCAAALSKDGGSRFFDALEYTDQLLKSNRDATLDRIIIDPLASSRIVRTPTPRRGSPFAYGRGGRGRGVGAPDGSRTNSPRPSSALSSGRGRGSPYDPAFRGTGGRGRGRGGGGGGAGRGESLLDRLDI